MPSFIEAVVRWCKKSIMKIIVIFTKKHVQWRTFYYIYYKPAIVLKKTILKMLITL